MIIQIKYCFKSGVRISTKKMSHGVLFVVVVVNIWFWTPDLPRYFKSIQVSFIASSQMSFSLRSLSLNLVQNARRNPIIRGDIMYLVE